MARYYYRRSMLGTFLRWWLGFGLLFVLLMGASWVFTELLPALAPFAVVCGLVAAVFWLVSRVRG